MMPQMCLTDAALQFGGTLINPDGYFSAVSINSRTTNVGDLFVAIEGENFDAHSYLSTIADKISGAVVSRPNKALDIPQWVVQDTTKALGDLARLRRDSFQGTVVALTGSSGKTSVKEAISIILSQTYEVHATSGNLNNHFGVPLTLLAMDTKTDIAVIEMGASAIGEIDYLSSIAQPDIALVNNAQSAHIEGFGSLKAIALAKAEIYKSLKSDGTAVLNLDQPWVDQWLEIIGERNYISFSITEERADLFAKNIKDTGDGYFSFDLCINQKFAGASAEQNVRLKHPGLHSISNGLAAAACAFAAGAGLTEIVYGLENVALIPGRLQHKVLSDNCVVIDDSYNANPDSFKTAIDVLSKANSHRILVMGDMGELGDHAKELHREVGLYAKNAKIDSLYAVGANSEIASQEFMGQHFPDQAALIDSLKAQIIELEASHESVIILVKGSRSSAMENVVQALFSGEKSSC